MISILNGPIYIVFASDRRPFEGRYPATIHVPVMDDDDQPGRVDTRVDYEAEIGMVIGQRLIWEDVKTASDRDLYDAVIGYVLVSDSKARNPQVVQNIISRDNPLPVDPGPYLTGNERIDRQIGFWHKETCLWWSYAACSEQFPRLSDRHWRRTMPSTFSQGHECCIPGISSVWEHLAGPSLPSNHKQPSIWRMLCYSGGNRWTGMTLSLWWRPSHVSQPRGSRFLLGARSGIPAAPDRPVRCQDVLTAETSLYLNNEEQTL